MKLPILDNRKDDRIYYLSPLSQQKFKKLRIKARFIQDRPCNCTRPLHWEPGSSPGKFTKEVIERFPRYLRRGGEYGHY